MARGLRSTLCATGAVRPLCRCSMGCGRLAGCPNRLGCSRGMCGRMNADAACVSLEELEAAFSVVLVAVFTASFVTLRLTIPASPPMEYSGKAG